MGHGTIRYSGMDYNSLVEMRRKHQTKQAATGVRTRKTEVPNMTDSLRGQVVRAFHSALREAQDQSAVGTGVERQLRWRAAAPGGRDGIVDSKKTPALTNGNAANAAVVAGNDANQVSSNTLFDVLLLSTSWFR
jgi:hypothetical protein